MATFWYRLTQIHLKNGPLNGERERERETDERTDGWTDRQTDRQTETEGQRDRERERHGDRFEQIGFFFVGWILFETTQAVKGVHLSSGKPFSFDLFAPELILTPGRIKVITHHAHLIWRHLV